MVPVKLLQRADSEERAVPAKAEERDGRIEEAVHVQGMDALGRGVRTGERQVPLQQLANVVGSRVIYRDLTLRHSTTLHDPNPAPSSVQDARRMRGVVTLPSKTSQTRVWLRSRRSRAGPRAWRMTLATSSLASISVFIA